MLEWKTRKPFGVARVGKLDPRLLNVAALLAHVSVMASTTLEVCWLTVK